MKAAVDSARRIRFESFELDLRTCELRKDGAPVKLQGQPMQILVMLLERPGEIVTREELQKTLWPNDTFVEFDHSINAAIKRLRHALGDSAESPKYIETLARRGYRFIWPIDVTGTTLEQNRAAKPIPVSANATPQPKNHRLLLSGAFVTATLAVLLGLNVGGWREKLRPRASGSHIDSLAVLPLENLSRDPDQEYFADGMTEALITDLGNVSALRVISRRSVIHFKGTKKALPEIARELNVDAVLEGTVEHSGNRVRISVNLIQASPERHLWAKNYDRELKDILLLESELAQAITGEIRISLTRKEQARLASAHAVNPDAYEAYVKARFFLNKRTESGIAKAVELFNEALGKDSNYAEAHAALAQCYGLAAFYGVLSFREAWDQARVSAERALALDESLSEAHAAMALVLDANWQWQKADYEFKQAIELSPNYTDIRTFYVNYLLIMGRVDEAIALAQGSEKLDPISAMAAATLGTALTYARRYDDAIVENMRAIELDPTFPIGHLNLGRAYELRGMLPQSIAELEKAAETFGRTPLFLGFLGHSYAVSGRRTAALKVVSELEKPSMRKLHPAFHIGLIYSGLGDKDSAFKWFELAYREHLGATMAYLQDPIFDPVRSDPRFVDLVRRVGLPTIH